MASRMWTQTNSFQSWLVWEVGKVKSSIWGVSIICKTKLGGQLLRGSRQQHGQEQKPALSIQYRFFHIRMNPQELLVPATKLTPEPLGKQPLVPS